MLGNHKYRNCQNLSTTDFSASPSALSVEVGGMVVIEVMNNLPTNVTFATFLSRAGPDGSLSEGTPHTLLPTDSGYWLLHYSDALKEHFRTVDITYHAPSHVPNGTRGVDLLSFRSGGREVRVAIQVLQQSIAHIVVTPDPFIIRVGQHGVATAAVTDGEGRPVLGTPLGWSTTDPTIASVDQYGVVTGVSTGITTVTASSGTVTGSTQVTVLPQIAYIKVVPDRITLRRGYSATAVATAFDNQDRPMVGETFTWRSSDPTVASVSSTGLVSGLAEGGANAIAYDDNVFGVAGIYVTTDSLRSVGGYWKLLRTKCGTLPSAVNYYCRTLPDTDYCCPDSTSFIVTDGYFAMWPDSTLYFSINGHWFIGDSTANYPLLTSIYSNWTYGATYGAGNTSASIAFWDKSSPSHIYSARVEQSREGSWDLVAFDIYRFRPWAQFDPLLYRLRGSGHSSIGTGASHAETHASRTPRHVPSGRSQLTRPFTSKQSP